MSNYFGRMSRHSQWIRGDAGCRLMNNQAPQASFSGRHPAAPLAR
ncbi:MAG: hypothetical protein Q8K97_10535 [Pseudohongiella sp.]|nr:hypothetical protein [Pseudohongiella sp.]